MNIHHHHQNRGELTIDWHETFIDRTVDIDLTGSVIVSCNTMISDGVKILTHDHLWKHSRKRRCCLKDIKKVTTFIHPDVFIGKEAMLICVEDIGEGAVIGARSVVTKDVPEYEVWAGNPAVKIGERAEPPE